MVEKEVYHTTLKEMLNEKQIKLIVSQSIGDDVPWKLIASEIKPAADGIAGFLAEHLKAVLNIEVKGNNKKIYLFVKRIPVFNKTKIEFIEKHQFFTREHLMFKLMDEFEENSSNLWSVKPYIYTESMFVMKDLAYLGYKNTNAIEVLDLQHVIVTTTSLAAYHATFVNYETKKSIELKRSYNSFEEFSHCLTEGNFYDSPWLRTAAKLSANFLKIFSTKSYRTMPDLEPILAKLFVEICDILREYKDTVNVLIHKDLWANNIMFKYEDNIPVKAVFIDYQSIRYAPPAFDLMIFLYLTTDKSFREEKQQDIFDHYYSVFVDNLSDDSKERLEGLGYDKENFLSWCERGRELAMMITMVVYPVALLDSKTAQELFDNPETYEKYVFEDRTEPLAAYSNKNEAYKYRNVALTEEFIETFVLKEI